MFTNVLKTVFQVTVCHKVMKLDKIPPNGLLSKLSNGLHVVNLFELHYQINFVMNTIQEGDVLTLGLNLKVTPRLIHIDTRTETIFAVN